MLIDWYIAMVIDWRSQTSTKTMSNDFFVALNLPFGEEEKSLKIEVKNFAFRYDNITCCV